MIAYLATAGLLCTFDLSTVEQKLQAYTSYVEFEDITLLAQALLCVKKLVPTTEDETAVRTSTDLDMRSTCASLLGS